MKIQFLLLFLSITIIACSIKEQSNNLDTWKGKYFYEEEPIHAIAGYYMAMEWQLQIKDTSGKYIGNLEINGQQTYSKLQGNIVGNAKTISFIYDKTIEGSNENLKRGDTVFQLVKEGTNLITQWKELEPRLKENPPKQCNCFQQNGSID
jgi:hypothetical protein